jgi:hypothetical protein
MTGRTRTTLIYADSGVGKTTQLYFLAKDYLETNPGKTVRLISCSGGGWHPFEDSGLIEQGLVDAIDLTKIAIDAGQALASIKALSIGQWPIRVNSGGNLAAGKMHLSLDKMCSPTSETKQKVGMYLFEDLTQLARLLLSHLGGKEEGTGFKHAWKIEEDGYSVGGLQEGHYGLVQNEIYKLMCMGFCSMASLSVEHFVATALVGKGEDKRSKTIVYGPKSAGDATTFEIPSWFNDCFYLDVDSYSTKEGELTVAHEDRRGWWKKHLDPETLIPYPAKVRFMPEYMPLLDKKWPQGYIPLQPTAGLDKFYKFSRSVTKLVKSGKTDELQKKMKGE